MGLFLIFLSTHLWADPGCEKSDSKKGISCFVLWKQKLQELGIELKGPEHQMGEESETTYQRGLKNDLPYLIKCESEVGISAIPLENPDLKIEDAGLFFLSTEFVYDQKTNQFISYPELIASTKHLSSKFEVINKWYELFLKKGQKSNLHKIPKFFPALKRTPSDNKTRVTIELKLLIRKIDLLAKRKANNRNTNLLGYYLRIYLRTLEGVGLQKFRIPVPNMEILFQKDQDDRRLYTLLSIMRDIHRRNAYLKMFTFNPEKQIELPTKLTDPIYDSATEIVDVDYQTHWLLSSVNFFKNASNNNITKFPQLREVIVSSEDQTISSLGLGLNVSPWYVKSHNLAKLTKKIQLITGEKKLRLDLIKLTYAPEKITELHGTNNAKITLLNMLLRKEILHPKLFTFINEIGLYEISKVSQPHQRDELIKLLQNPKNNSKIKGNFFKDFMRVGAIKGIPADMVKLFKNPFMLEKILPIFAKSLFHRLKNDSFTGPTFLMAELLKLKLPTNQLMRISNVIYEELGKYLKQREKEADPFEKLRFISLLESLGILPKFYHDPKKNSELIFSALAKFGVNSNKEVQFNKRFIVSLYKFSNNITLPTDSIYNFIKFAKKNSKNFAVEFPFVEIIGRANKKDKLRDKVILTKVLHQHIPGYNYYDIWEELVKQSPSKKNLDRLRDHSDPKLNPSDWDMYIDNTVSYLLNDYLKNTQLKINLRPHEFDFILDKLKDYKKNALSYYLHNISQFKGLTKMQKARLVVTSYNYVKKAKEFSNLYMPRRMRDYVFTGLSAIAIVDPQNPFLHEQISQGLTERNVDSKLISVALNVIRQYPSIGSKYKERVKSIVFLGLGGSKKKIQQSPDKAEKIETLSITALMTYFSLLDHLIRSEPNLYKRISLQKERLQIIKRALETKHNLVNFIAMKELKKNPQWGNPYLTTFE